MFGLRDNLATRGLGQKKKPGFEGRALSWIDLLDQIRKAAIRKTPQAVTSRLKAKSGIVAVPLGFECRQIVPRRMALAARLVLAARWLSAAIDR